MASWGRGNSCVCLRKLQLARSGTSYVCLQKLQMDRSGIEGATLNSISTKVNRCWLKWYESSPPEGVHLTEPRPPLQGKSKDFSVLDVTHHFPLSLSWISPLHICLQCELDREENVTSVRRTADRGEQFTLGMSLNISEIFLKKPCTESTEVTVSGLISRGASVFQLWHDVWFNFPFIDLTTVEQYGLAVF